MIDKPPRKPDNIHTAFRTLNLEDLRFMPDIRILFICHGNICRSPMAEFFMKDLVKKQRLADRFEIASAATSSEELGNPVHPGTRRKLSEVGISCKGKYARRMTVQDYRDYDLLIGMDETNMRNMRRIVGGDPDGKMIKLLSFCGEGSDVADPWWTGNFEDTYRDVKRGCEALLAHLCKENGWKL